jgi:hypothetical protein
MVKRVTIPFPDDLHEAIRLKAESENRSFVKQIQEAAKRNVGEVEPPSDGTSRPRVSA